METVTTIRILGRGSYEMRENSVHLRQGGLSWGEGGKIKMKGFNPLVNITARPAILRGT